MIIIAYLYSSRNIYLLLLNVKKLYKSKKISMIKCLYFDVACHNSLTGRIQ